MGFRDRLRKVSKAASQKLGNRTNKERSSSSSSSSSLDASSSSLSSPCPKRQPLSAEAHQREVAMKTMSMMTPDMLEVLGLTEALDDPNSKAPLPWEPITSSPIKQIPRKKHVRINESYNTTFRRGRPQDEEYSRPSRRITKGSSSNHSSSDSVSTSSMYSSSSESYEPVVKSHEDVCPSCWVLPEDNDCKGLTYVAGAVLALPVACAFICADNIFGTDYFGSMTGCSSNEASRCELLPTSIAIPPNKVVARCW